MDGLTRLVAGDLRSALTAYRDVLRAHREAIDRLNVYPVPDADTGTNMVLTMESVVTAVEGTDEMRSTCLAMSRGALLGGRGVSGVVLSQILGGLGASLEGLDEVDSSGLAEALATADQAAWEALADPVEGTILTVLRAAAEAAREAATRGADLAEVLESSRVAAREALDRTPDLLPALRRAGVVDAGGAGFALLLDALLHVVVGRPLPESPWPPPEERGPPLDALGPRFEVTFLLEAGGDILPAFRAAWAGLGDAAVVVASGDTWSCHVHTDDPEGALQLGMAHGRPREVRITDLSRQVVEGEPAVGAPEALVTAVVAVVAGEGSARLFRSLGAQRLVRRRGSGDPSVGELLEAAEGVVGEQVVILTDDEKVVPAADQAGELAHRTVRVVPTAGMAEGLVALRAYDPGAPADENAARMGEAASRVRSGRLTQAVRDAGSEVGPVRAGDWIGMTAEGIRAIGGSAEEAASALLDDLLTDGRRKVTVIEGDGASPAVTERIVADLARRRPRATAVVHRGGQASSLYVFGVE